MPMYGAGGMGRLRDQMRRPPVLATLTLTGSLAYSASAAAGTLVANIVGVPAGSTPTITPNDGRLVVAGSAGAWTVVVGMTASSAGSFTLAVAAAGANGASATVTVSASGSASITSSSTVQQFAGSQHFFQSTADGPGTWSIGTGGNAADFTMYDAANGIWSVKTNAYGDGQTQLNKTVPIVFAPTDGRTAPSPQSVAVTLNTIAAPSQLSSSYTSDFVGPSGSPYTAGTKLTSLPGYSWSGSGSAPSNVPVVDGAGHLTSPSGADFYSASGAVLHSAVGSSTSRLVETFNVKRTTAANYTGITFVGAATDYQNCVTVTVVYDSNAGGPAVYSPIQLLQAGQSAVNLGTIAAPGIKADGSFDVVFTFSADGNTLVISLAGATTTSSAPIDLTGKTKGNLSGYSALQQGFNVNSVNVVEMLSTLSITTAPTFSATNQATYALAWGLTKPTALQHRLLDTSSNPVTGWITEPGQVINNDGTISYPASAPGAGPDTTQFRILNDTGVTAVASTLIEFLAPVPTLGYNVTSPNGYRPIPFLNDYGKFAAINSSQSQVAISTKSITGYANVVSDPGTMLTGFSDPSTMNIVSSSNGVHRIQITGDSSAASRYFTYSGTMTYFTVTRDSVSGKISAEAIAGIEGAALRDLDMSDTNEVPVNTNTVLNVVTDKNYLRSQAIGVYSNTPYQDITDLVAAVAASRTSFNTYWPVLRADISDSEMTAVATYWRDNLPQTMRITPQFGNEWPWNGFPGVYRILADGIRNGYYGSATPSSLSPTLTLNQVPSTGGSGGTNYNNSAGNTDSPAATTGTLIAYSFFSQGYQIYRAKQNVAAGAEINENANWTVAYSQSDVTLASRRWGSARFKQLLTIIQGVFGTTRYNAQIVPLVMGQLGTRLYDQLVTERTWDTAFWSMVGGIGHSWYVKPVGYDPTSATATNLEAAYRAAMPAILANIQQTVQDAYLLGKKVFLYEGLFEYDLTSYQNVTAFKNAVDTLRTGTAGQNMARDWTAMIRANVPGLFMAYDLVSDGLYSVKKDYTDSSNPLVLGMRAAMA